MESNSRLHSQIASDAGCSPEVAQMAAYLADLAHDGKTLDHAATMLRKGRADVRDIARDWGLSFSDYTPSDPIVMAWTKPERGQWVLTHKSKIVARVSRDPIDGCRNYTARWQREDASLCERGSSAEIAARRLSVEIDRRSIALFDADDIEIVFPVSGGAERLAPKRADNPMKLRNALLGAA